MKSVYDTIKKSLITFHPGVVTFPSTYVQNFVEHIIPAFGKVYDTSLEQNQLAFDNVLPSESIISVDNAKLISDKLCVAFCAMVLYYESIMHIMADALSLEFDIDKLPTSDRKVVRSKLRDNVKSSHFMECGVSTFSYSVWQDLFGSFNASLSSVRDSKLAKDVDSRFSELNSNQLDELSFLMCNYMYFLRAFCNNSIFQSQILEICDSLSKKYSL